MNNAKGSNCKHSIPKATEKLTKKLTGGPSCLSESLLISCLDCDMPFGHPGVPKKKINRIKTVREMAKNDYEEELVEDKSSIEDSSCDKPGEVTS